MLQDETLKNLSVPIPSNLRISTHTATCKISSEILLPIVAEKLEIDKDTENIYQVGKRKILKIKIWIKYFFYHAF